MLDIKTEGITKNALLEIESPTPELGMQVVQAKPKLIYKKLAATPKPVIRKQCTKVITGLTESLECF